MISYRAFKYAIYALLMVNVAYFFAESVGSTTYTYTSGMKWNDIIVAYAAPVDTAAWLILLLVLELETARIDERRPATLTGRLIMAINAICFSIIAYSFYGYVATTGIANGFAPYSGPDPCAQAGTDTTFLISLDKYVPLTDGNCTALAETSYFNQKLGMFADPANLHKLTQLVWLDVTNSAAWIIIVIILEIEIFLKSSARLGAIILAVCNGSKLLLYGLLILNTVWWLLLGAVWDAWDALLWLLAFFFIEMNVLSWQDDAPRRTGPRPARVTGYEPNRTTDA